MRFRTMPDRVWASDPLWILRLMKGEGKRNAACQRFFFLLKSNSKANTAL